jgi:hypothetical protein
MRQRSDLQRLGMQNRHIGVEADDANRFIPIAHTERKCEATGSLRRIETLFAAQRADGFEFETPVQIKEHMKKQRSLFADAVHVGKTKRFRFQYAGQRAEGIQQRVRDTVDVLPRDRIGQKQLQYDMIGHAVHALLAICFPDPFPMSFMYIFCHMIHFTWKITFRQS